MRPTSKRRARVGSRRLAGASVRDDARPRHRPLFGLRGASWSSKGVVPGRFGAHRVRLRIPSGGTHALPVSQPMLAAMNMRRSSRPTPSLLMMEASNPDAPVTLGQRPRWRPGRRWQAIRDYAATSLWTLTSPGDPGATAMRAQLPIHVIDEGKRRAQLKYQPQFSRADVELSMSSRHYNTYRATPLPETGYSVRYQGSPCRSTSGAPSRSTDCPTGIASPMQCSPSSRASPRTTGALTRIARPRRVRHHQPGETP